MTDDYFGKASSDMARHAQSIIDSMKILMNDSDLEKMIPIKQGKQSFIPIISFNKSTLEYIQCGYRTIDIYDIEIISKDIVYINKEFIIICSEIFYDEYDNLIVVPIIIKPEKPSFIETKTLNRNSVNHTPMYPKFYYETQNNS